MSAAAEFPWRLRESNPDLRLVFENAPFGVAVCQLQGNVTALNPALENMLADLEGIASSLSLADLTCPDDRSASARLLRELFEGERSSFRIDSGITGPDCRPMRWIVWRVRGTNGEPDYALAVTEGSADGQIEQRLHEAEKLEAVGRLAGGIAHDFNNLLTGVLLYCDLVLASLEPGHRVRKYAEEIRSAGIQATGLVRQLLSVARPAHSEPRVISLNEIVEGLRNLLVRLIGENIQLRFHLDPNLGMVKMDPTQAQQILLNLVLNARDAMPSGGEVTVETANCTVQVFAESRLTIRQAASLPCVLFVVADNGIGMEAETRAHLFETFFTTKANKGTGLGLASVHQIVTSSGGLIHVESAPACGTRFTVLLPLAQAAGLSVKNTNALPATTNSEGLALHQEE